MKTIGGHGIRGGNLALILSGIFFIFLGVTATISTGLGTSSLTILGFAVTNIFLVIIGFLLIIFALRSGANKAVLKTGA